MDQLQLLLILKKDKEQCYLTLLFWIPNIDPMVEDKIRIR